MNQAEQNEAVTGAPGVLEIGDELYLVDALTDSLLATLHGHIRETLDNPIKAIAADLEDLAPKYRKMAIEAAVEIKAGGGATLTHAAISRYLTTPKGAATFIWVLTRTNHPDLKRSTFEAIIDKDNVDEILGKLYKACRIDAVQKKATGPAS